MIYKNKEEDKSLIYESFDNFYGLMEVLDGRQNNPVMENSHASEVSRSDSWAGTKTFQEARDLFIYGDEKHYQILLEEMKKTNKKLSSFFSSVGNQSIPKVQVEGFVPHVPNALQNLPNAMITREIQSKKRKILKILYFDSANCGTEGESLSKAGIALLNVINALERQGISVALYLSFFSAHKGDEDTYAQLRLKNYEERLNLKKISFPLANPAMFRRIGFKWLETVPNLTETGYSCGYGRAKPPDYFIDNYPNAFDTINTYYIDAVTIEEKFEFDVEKIFDDIKERCMKI